MAYDQSHHIANHSDHSNVKTQMHWGEEENTMARSQDITNNGEFGESVLSTL